MLGGTLGSFGLGSFVLGGLPPTGLKTPPSGGSGSGRFDDGKRAAQRREAEGVAVALTVAMRRLRVKPARV